MKPLSLTEQTHRFDPSNIGANAPRGLRLLPYIPLTETPVTRIAINAGESPNER
jgi:hypothetical protein